MCTICGKPLVDKAPVVSALRETASGYDRYDCHPECWKTQERDWEPFSVWDGVYLAPVKEPIGGPSAKRPICAGSSFRIRSLASFAPSGKAHAP